MSTTNQWLERLSEATDYRQLQSIFSQLAAEATQSTDAGQLVASIDEAIRRIEQERARDDQELQAFQSRYGEFKEQQRGVLGWFRRHTPFTKTRKQERQHKDTIADQQAEILADNLVIARAQMLKQKLLPADQRQLGESSQRWRMRLAECDSIDRIRDYASTIAALSAELAVSDAFVGELRNEIDQFANADFASQEDRQLQKSDVQQARTELAEFEQELEEERSMQSEAIKQAGQLVTEELLQTNHDFYQLTQRTEELTAGKRLAKNAQERAENLADLLKKTRELSDQSEACRQQLDSSQTEHDRLQRDLESEQSRLQRLQRKLDKAAGPFEEARRDADRAGAAYDAAKRIYDQRRQDSASDSGDNHAIDAEFERVTRERDEALRVLEREKDPYDSIKSKYDKHRRESERGEQDLRKMVKTLAEIRDQEQSLENQIQHVSAELPPALAEFEPLLNDLLHCIDAIQIQSHVKTLSRSLQWSGALAGGFGSDFGAHHSQSNDLDQRMASLVDAISKDRHELKQRFSAAKAEKHQQWAQRCQQLLGDEVAKLIDDAA